MNPPPPKTKTRKIPHSCPRNTTTNKNKKQKTRKNKTKNCYYNEASLLLLLLLRLLCIDDCDYSFLKLCIHVHIPFPFYLTWVVCVFVPFPLCTVFPPPAAGGENGACKSSNSLRPFYTFQQNLLNATFDTRQSCLYAAKVMSTSEITRCGAVAWLVASVSGHTNLFISRGKPNAL